MKQQPMETRGLLQSYAIGIYSAFALPDFRPMLSYCSPARAGTHAASVAAAVPDTAPMIRLLDCSEVTRAGRPSAWVY